MRVNAKQTAQGAAHVSIQPIRRRPTSGGISVVLLGAYSDAPWAVETEERRGERKGSKGISGTLASRELRKEGGDEALKQGKDLLRSAYLIRCVYV